MPAAPHTRRRNDLLRRVKRLQEQLQAAEAELATLPPPERGSPPRAVWAGFKWYPSIAAACFVHDIRSGSLHWRIKTGWPGWRWPEPGETAETVPPEDQGPVAPGLARTQGGTVVRWQLARRPTLYETQAEAVDAFHRSHGRDPLEGELRRRNVEPEDAR